MNKKYIFMILFFFSFFLFGFTDVHAMKGTLSFDDNNHFNYFYEMKNNTPFYQFLNSQGRSLIYTLDSYYDIGISLDSDYTISLYNSNEFTLLDAEYLIVVSFPMGYIFYDNTSFSFNLGNSHYFYLFDENGEFLEAGHTDNLYSIVDDINQFYDKNELSYILSKFYITNYNVHYSSNSTSTPELFVNNFIIDGESYVFEESTNYSKFRNWFISKFGNHHMYDDDSLEDFIDYYSKNLVISGNYRMRCLYDTLFSVSDSLVLSGNYSTFDISSNEGGFYLVPKKSENADYNIYFYSTSKNAEIFLNYYEFDTSSLKNNIDYKGFNPANLYSISYLLNVNSFEISNETSVLNYVYHISTKTFKFSTIIYYDSDAYTLKRGGNTFTLTNPNTDQSFSFDVTEQNKFYNDTYNSMIQESEEAKDALSDEFSIEFALENIKTVATSLGNAFLLIGSLITMMFTSFPLIVQQFFLAIFVIGGLIIIVKLIRG